MTDDYVLYRENTKEAFTFKDMDDLRQYAIDKLGMSNRNNKPDDFAIKVYMAEIGTPFEYDGEKFIVWDDEFSGYHQYHASTKKSKSQPATFNDMVKKQRMKKLSIKKDDEISIEDYRKINIEALQMMIDALEDSIEAIESADSEALDLMNSELASGLGGGYYGMFLIGGSEADIDGILEKMKGAINYCKRSQEEYRNGEYDW